MKQNLKLEVVQVVKPTLVVLAAGMGSRFGGLKQITPVDDEGDVIIDFSLYDAKKAGFEKVVFIIKHEIEADFKASLGHRMEKHFDVRYAYQQLDMLPEGFQVPEGREKPWGTAHAVLCAADVIDGPFAVINGDDFYGATAFQQMYDFLVNDAKDNLHAMAGYLVENTLTENGSVARGVCEVKDGKLVGIAERTSIIPKDGGAAYTEDGVTYTFIPPGTYVSMNFWGFGHGFLDESKRLFKPFLEKNISTNPLKSEFFLPIVVDELLATKKAEILVLPTTEKWYGVTYSEDLPSVKESIKAMKEKGIYPKNLWG
jgi:NDP-sugar pyrophosphorylase family protein